MPNVSHASSHVILATILDLLYIDSAASPRVGQLDGSEIRHLCCPGQGEKLRES